MVVTLIGSWGRISRPIGHAGEGCMRNWHMAVTIIGHMVVTIIGSWSRITVFVHFGQDQNENANVHGYSEAK